ITAHDLALVREVHLRHGDVLTADVLPDGELGLVADREHAHVLAVVYAGVVQVPQLGTLILRGPLAELVTEGEHALFRTSLLFVAARAADAGVELMRSNRF